MADESEELRIAREAARTAREEAEKLRSQARELEHRLRDEERRTRNSQRQQEREDRRSAHAERMANRHGPHGERPDARFGMPGSIPPGERGGDADGVRVEQALDFTGVRSLHIDQTAGKTIMRPVAAEEAPGMTVSANKTPPRVEVSRVGDRLMVAVKLQSGWLFRRRQGATLYIRIPNDLQEVRIHLGAGEIEMRDISADAINLNTGAGEIKTMATRGTMNADTGAGRINIQSHRGLCRCDTGTGDLMMDIAEVASGEYRGNVGMGRVELRLPPGHEVYVRATSGIGKSRVEYPSGPETAEIRARIETGIGEASIRARRPEAPEKPGGSPKPQREARPDATRRRRETEELRVLQMLEQGRISSQEAAELIAALQGANLEFEPESEGPPDSTEEVTESPIDRKTTAIPQD